MCSIILYYSSYKKAFKDSKQAMPDNCRSDYAIKIYNRKEYEPQDEIEIISHTH